MSITANAIIATILFGPGILGGAAYARSLRGAKADSDAIRTVLAISAYERALAAAEQDENPGPPDGGEPTPAPEAEPTQQLATVIDFPTRRAA
ncbi:hypothetical protein GCM10010441_38460 [Kitasatospora paracochleata]|uniref:Secreted protein n=1 Tax=Kitasatospora paracochleata TaxID=58354 RepID=A0ABT1IPP9_9ACTN|nr:hypothetical protein [Kitasatospora paracochleata]MCP2306928.1 hypothetical protein [Kitasatospora paracochleata]